MKTHRWIAGILCFLLVIAPIFTFVQAVPAKAGYDEATVLDQIARDWIDTCELNTFFCTTGLDIYALGAITEGFRDELKQQLLSDIIDGFKKSSTVQCKIDVEALCAALDTPNSLKEDIQTFMTTSADAEDLDERLSHSQAKSKINNTIKNGEVSPGVTVLEVIKENYSFLMGIAGCGAASVFFQNALNTTDLTEKRNNILNGAYLATIGCEMSISDTDKIVKFDGVLSSEELMTKIAENGIDLVKEIVPEVGVFYDALTITADVGIKVASMSRKLDAIAEFMKAPAISEEDMSDFFDAVSNQYGRYTFDIRDFEVTMHQYKGYLLRGDAYEKVVVPETVYGFPVKKFSGCFAKGLSITELTIPSGVTSYSATYVIQDCDRLKKVEYNAMNCKGGNLGSFFYDCDSDFELIFGKGVTATPEGFLWKCGLSSIVFPEGITTMYSGAVRECENLKSVSIPSTVKKFVIHYGAPGVISGCKNLKTAYYNPIDAEGSYYNWVFNNCGNNGSGMDFIIGAGVKATPISFLLNCGMKSVTFPEGMTTIREYAISKCQRLETITIPSTVTQFSRAIASDYVFSDCNDLKTLNYNAKNAKGGLVSIFRDIQSDFTVNFGEGVTEIPKEFMANCGLTSISFPETVVTIHDNCLVNCDSLKYVTVPSSVTTIGHHLVSDCDKIDTISFNANCTPSSNVTMISDCENVGMKVILGDNVTTIPKHFIDNCGITEFTYPEGVTEIGSYSLTHCGALKTVVIPSTVTAMGRDIVTECENLSDLYYRAIDPKRTVSSYWLFDKCGNVSGMELHLQDGIKAIPNEFMRNCGVRAVTVPEGVTAIGDKTFDSCEKLESVTLPSSISKITIVGNTGLGQGVIYYCKNLKTLNYNAKNIPSGTVVYSCSSDFTVNFGASVKSLPKKFMISCGITTIDLPESITEIGSRAFSGCNSLASIYFENPDCKINVVSGDTLPKNATIFGYFDSTAYDYSVKYDRAFELIKEKNTGSFGAKDNFFYKFEEATQTLTVKGADKFAQFTREDGAKTVDLPDFPVKKVHFKGCDFSGSLSGLLGEYKADVEEVTFTNCSTKNVTNMEAMFEGCSKLTTLDMSGFRVSSTCNTDNMLSGCLRLEKVITPDRMDDDTAIRLPYAFSDKNGVVLIRITPKHCRKTITINRSAANTVGDASNDHVIDTQDQMILSRYLANWGTYGAEGIDLSAADLNCDGVVDTLDRMILSRHLAGWEGYEILPYPD